MHMLLARWVRSTSRSCAWRTTDAGWRVASAAERSFVRIRANQSKHTRLLLRKKSFVALGGGGSASEPSHAEWTWRSSCSRDDKIRRNRSRELASAPPPLGPLPLPLPADLSAAGSALLSMRSRPSNVCAGPPNGDRSRELTRLRAASITLHHAPSCGSMPSRARSGGECAAAHATKMRACAAASAGTRPDSSLRVRCSCSGPYADGPCEVSSRRLHHSDVCPSPKLLP